MPEDKIKEKIKISGDRNAEFIYLASDNSAKKMKSLVSTKTKELEQFYDINLSELTVELTYSRKELNQKIDRKTPEWVISISTGDKIYIFSPSVMKEQSSHEEINPTKTFTHELVHIFNAQLNSYPVVWLNEGLALLLAKQEIEDNFTNENWSYFLDNFLNAHELNDFDDFTNHAGYGISYFLVKRIIKDFNKQKLLDLIKINAKKNNFTKKASDIINSSFKKYIKNLR